ncbi:uncharacterized protein KZ484_019823 [Pholidichthys leucotaenia]
MVDESGGTPVVAADANGIPAMTADAGRTPDEAAEEGGTPDMVADAGDCLTDGAESCDAKTWGHLLVGSSSGTKEALFSHPGHGCGAGTGPSKTTGPSIVPQLPPRTGRHIDRAEGDTGEAGTAGGEPITSPRNFNWRVETVVNNSTNSGYFLSLGCTSTILTTGFTFCSTVFGEQEIIFFEDRNFQGQFHECNNDSSDLHTYLHRCNSIRVEGGFWVVYERPNFKGRQYVLNPGEYREYQYWQGINDAIRSCRIIRNVGSSWRLKVWEKPNFGGLTMEMADSMPTLPKHWHGRSIHSCKVLEGAWVFFEHPNYRGQQYLLERGDYRRFSEWGSMQPGVGSIQCVKEQ